MKANDMQELRDVVKMLMDNLKIHLAVPTEQITINRAELAAMVDDCQKALSKPRRQCDVGTAEEQYARFEAECRIIRKRNTVEPCAGCPCSRDGEGTDDCQLRWAQMPYDESEVKEEGK